MNWYVLLTGTYEPVNEFYFVLTYNHSYCGCQFSVVVLINVVTLRQAQLVPGWVTVFGWVKHHGAEQGTQVYLAWTRPLWIGWNEYPAKAAHIRGLAVFAGAWLKELASRDQCRCTGSKSTLEACSQRCMIQIHTYYTLLYWLQLSCWTACCECCRIIVVSCRYDCNYRLFYEGFSTYLINHYKIVIFSIIVYTCIAGPVRSVVGLALNT